MGRGNRDFARVSKMEMHFLIMYILSFPREYGFYRDFTNFKNFIHLRISVILVCRTHGAEHMTAFSGKKKKKKDTRSAQQFAPE